MSILQKACCFFIFGKMLIYLCPDQKYEAYYGLLLQWTLLAILILPLLAPVKGERMLGEAEKMWETWQNEMGKVREGKLEEEASAMTREAAKAYVREHREEVQEMYEAENGQDGSGLYGEESGQDGSGLYEAENGQDGSGLYGEESGQDGSGLYEAENGQDRSGLYGEESGQDESGLYGEENGQEDHKMREENERTGRKEAVQPGSGGWDG